MLKRKRTKGSGSQALIPEGKPEREAPVEQLWERSWEGRKETNRKPSTRNRKDGMGNQAGRKGKDLGSESGTEAPRKPAVRRKREDKWKGRTDRLSSEMLRWKRTKGTRKSGTDPGGEIQKGSTCGTAVGAKQGRTKGNEQRTEYAEPERSGRETSRG